MAEVDQFQREFSEAHAGARLIPLRWEQRKTTHLQEVQAVKNCKAYGMYQQMAPKERRQEDDPQTPDPNDETISERTGKVNSLKWKIDVKKVGWTSCREWRSGAHP